MFFVTFSQNDKISLFGIKNEIQSAQIMFNSSENINSFDLKVGNLVIRPQILLLQITYLKALAQIISVPMLI